MSSPSPIALFYSGNASIDAIPFSLKFKYPFRLAVGTRTETSLVFLRIRDGDETYFGEASLPPYLKESQNTVLAYFKQLDWAAILDEGGYKSDVWRKGQISNSPASAALSIALHDRASRQADLALWEHLGVPQPLEIQTSMTIGISNGAELDRKLKEANDFEKLKLKLGSADDEDMLRYFKRKTTKAFCADANQAWTNRDAAARICEVLMKADCQFLEQPFPVGREEDAYWLRQRVSLPIIGDESIQHAKDLVHFESCFDGVNVKLMKCGGISEAVHLLKLAREMGKIPVLSAMAESQCAVTAAAHLGALADWVDLDGPLLSANDPFEGIKYADGKIEIPGKVGSGIDLSANGFVH